LIEETGVPHLRCTAHALHRVRDTRRWNPLMPMLSVSGLTKRFGALRAVNNVSFDVNEGEILGLIGPNGSGKSTTFNCIAGLYAPDGGTITFEGADITGLTPNRVCHKGIGRTFQIPRPFRNLTPIEDVASAAFFGPDRG